MAETAKRLDVDYIVTRNKKDYAKSNVPIISADEFIELLKDELNTI